MATLRRASLRRVIAAATSASSSHPEVQPSLSPLYLSFFVVGVGWVGEWRFPVECSLRLVEYSAVLIESDP
jgi:hypothetical protein